MKLTKLVRGKDQSDFQEKGNMTLIHPTYGRFQIFMNKVVNSLVGKYQIIY